MIDIHLSDTYYIIALTQIFWLSAIFTLIVWAIYLLTNKLLYSRVLSRTHIFITILTLAAFIFFLYFGTHFFNQTPRRYYDLSIWNSSGSYGNYYIALAIIIGLFVTGQIAFIINILTGLFKRKI